MGTNFTLRKFVTAESAKRIDELILKSGLKWNVLDNLMLGCHRFAAESLAGQFLWTRSVRRAEAELRAHVEEVIDLLDTLGVDRFYLCGHDRGGRVAHRLALDHGARVRKMCVLEFLFQVAAGR